MRTGSHIQIVLGEDTEWISAAGDYIELHVRGRLHLLRETMNALEKKLDRRGFFASTDPASVRTVAIVELRGIGCRSVS